MCSKSLHGFPKLGHKLVCTSHMVALLLHQNDGVEGINSISLVLMVYISVIAYLKLATGIQ